MSHAWGREYKSKQYLLSTHTESAFLMREQKECRLPISLRSRKQQQFVRRTISHHHKYREYIDWRFMKDLPSGPPTLYLDGKKSPRMSPVGDIHVLCSIVLGKENVIRLR